MHNGHSKLRGGCRGVALVSALFHKQSSLISSSLEHEMVLTFPHSHFTEYACGWHTHVLFASETHYFPLSFSDYHADDFTNEWQSIMCGGIFVSTNWHLQH